MSADGPTVLFDLSILSTDTRHRGIGRYITELALELDRLPKDGVRIRFLERLGWNGEIDVGDDAEASIARITDPKRGETGRLSWAYRSRLGLSRAARKLGVDLVHIPHTSTTPLFNSTRRVVTSHDLIPLMWPDHYVSWEDGFVTGRRWLDHRRCHSAEHIIAISEATARDLYEHLEVAPAKVSVVHLGIDHRAWSPEALADDEKRVSDAGVGTSPFMLYVGDADWRKNYDGMFAALALARKERDVNLVWAGKLSDARMALVQQEIARQQVEGAVLFTGFVPDATLKALYRQALGTLFVSRAEGFGLPVLEAMAIGSPVITSDRSSMPEIAGDGACLVDPESPPSIADAITALATDADYRTALRERGIKQAAKFTRERFATETLAVYRELLADP